MIYLAPDCIQNGVYDLDTDYWALGILNIFLIDGKTPLEDKNQLEKMFEIIKRKQFTPIR